MIVRCSSCDCLTSRSTRRHPPQVPSRCLNRTDEVFGTYRAGTTVAVLVSTRWMDGKNGEKEHYPQRRRVRYRVDHGVTPLGPPGPSEKKTSHS
jgi:hypothetical protein